MYNKMSVMELNKFILFYNNSFDVYFRKTIDIKNFKIVMVHYNEFCYK